MHLSELIIIGGAAFGALVLMSPKKVLIDLLKQVLRALKGAPYSKEAYEELFKALYELFMMGRRSGMVALEEHVMNPENSAIFSKYPSFQKNHHAIQFLCNGLRPIIDGKIKPDQLKLLLEIELDAMEEEHEKPVGVLTSRRMRCQDSALSPPCWASSSRWPPSPGPSSRIGEKVAAALVGTFLGIFISYGFMNPLAVNMEFINMAEMTYIRCIAASVIGFANGMSPIMAVEVARRGLSSEVKPTSDDLETMLKAPQPAPAK